MRGRTGQEGTTARRGRLARAAARCRALVRDRARRRRLVQGVMAACVLALLPATWLRLSTDDRLGPDAASAPKAPVALVFGAGLRDGTPSPYLAHRLDTAAGLYRAGTVRVLLVSGDNSRRDYDEPSAMRRYLTARGVPASRIVADHAGFDTWDSCARASRLFGVHRALLVSQDFHVRRAVALCRAAGIDSWGVPVREPRDATWYAGGLRELPAAGKAALDAALTPDPHFLGPREQGVRRALAAARADTRRHATGPDNATGPGSGVGSGDAPGDGHAAVHGDGASTGHAPGRSHAVVPDDDAPSGHAAAHGDAAASGRAAGPVHVPGSGRAAGSGDGAVHDDAPRRGHAAAHDHAAAQGHGAESGRGAVRDDAAASCHAAGFRSGCCA